MRSWSTTRRAHRQCFLADGGGRRATARARYVYPNDLWTWDGERWRKLEPLAGTRRQWADVPVLSYDAHRRRLVMFGRGDGTGQPSTWTSDVWEWDDSRWFRIPTSDLPRLLHPAVSYDPARQRVVIFGGGLVQGTGAFAASRARCGTGTVHVGRHVTPLVPINTLHHAWEDWITAPVLYVRSPNASWRRIETAHTPGVRNCQALAWDNRRHRLVLFGGTTKSGELLGGHMGVRRHRLDQASAVAAAKLARAERRQH